MKKLFKKHANPSIMLIVVLAMAFTFSCDEPPYENERYYSAIIVRTAGVPYTFLYPNVSMEYGGYFLNEMAQYAKAGGPYYGFIEESIYSNSGCEDEYETLGGNAQMRYHSLGVGNARSYCEFEYSPIEKSAMTTDWDDCLTANEMKDWLKSVNTPFYNDINREIFADGNTQFLGFYQIDGEEYYIYLYFSGTVRGAV